MSLETTSVSKLYIKGESSGRYDLATLNVVWALNRIPTAQGRVITGMGVLGSKTTKIWSNPDPTELWEVWMEDAAGSKTKLLSGYVLAVSEDESPSAHGSGVHINVSIAATPVMLSSAQAAAYGYWNVDEGVTINAGASKPLVTAKSNALLNSVASVIADGTKRIKELTGYDVKVTVPTNLEEFLIGAAALFHDKHTASEDFQISDYFRTVNHVDFKETSGVKDAKQLVTVAMAKAYLRKWATASVWAALTGTCQMMSLSIAPKLDGSLEIMPALAWLKKPAVEIAPSAVLGLSDNTDQGGLLYTPDEVVVTSKLPDRYGGTKGAGNWKVAAYPDEKDVEELARGRVATVGLPFWAEPYMLRHYQNNKGKGKGDGKLADGAKDKKAETKTEKAKVAEAVPNVCVDYAKLCFAQRKNARSSLSLKMPWNRLQLVDAIGSTAVVKDLSTYADRKEHDVFGMIQGVSLSLSKTIDSGSAFLTVRLSHVRDKDANDKWGVDDHPFYKYNYDNAAVKAASKKLAVQKSDELNLDSRLSPSG